MHNMKTEEIANKQETKRYVNVETGIYKYTTNGIRWLKSQLVTAMLVLDAAAIILAP